MRTIAFVGRITIDDVVDVIRDEAEHSLMGAVGLDEEDDMFAPAMRSAKPTCSLARHQSGDSVRGRLGRRPVPDDRGQDRAARRADAGRAQHGRHRRNTVADHHDPCHRARSDRPDERARACCSKELLVGILNGILWAAVVAVIAYPVVPRLAPRRRDCRRHVDQSDRRRRRPDSPSR